MTTPKGTAYTLVLGLGFAGITILWTGQQRILTLRTELANRQESKRGDDSGTLKIPAPVEPKPATRTEAPIPKAAQPAQKQNVPLLRVPASAWVNQGGATPKACFESVILSAISGEPERMQKLLTCDSQARRALNEVFQKMPETLRTEYKTPEAMLAARVAVQVPSDITAYGILGERQVNASETVIAIQLERKTKGTAAEAYFVFRNEGDAWRLVVPDGVIRNMLKGFVTPDRGKN